jgi:dolichol-phosphate mannosyltransferase
MGIRTLVIIPTFNEKENIASFLLDLDEIRGGIFPDYEIDILNVDDSSPDGTAEIASQLGLPNFYQIKDREKVGLGPAYLSGFSWGLLRDYDFFVEVDGDGSHLVKQLSFLLEASKDADLVIGTRWMPGGEIENWPKYRRVISRVGTIYAAKVLKLPFRDLTSGYRVLSRDLLTSLDLRSISTKGYGFQIEIALLAFANGFSIKEVPITFIERGAGKSKMSIGIVFEAFSFVTSRAFKRIFDLR